MSPSEQPPTQKMSATSEWAANVIASRKNDFGKLCQRFSKSPDTVGQTMGGFVSKLQGMLQKVGCPVSAAEDAAQAAELESELRTQFETQTGNAPDAAADEALIRPFALVHALALRILNGPGKEKRAEQPAHATVQRAAQRAKAKAQTHQPAHETPAAPVEPSAENAGKDEGEIDWSEITGQK